MKLFRRKISLGPCPVQFLFAALLCCLLLSGCVISPRRTLGGGPGGGPTPSPTPTPQPGAQGRLYVANQGDDSILRFDNAASAGGNLAPAATISGASTGLNAPNYIFLDSANDRLYVTNQGSASILVFDSASALTTGSPAPTRTITGANTGLTIPVDLAVDSGKDLLYVVNASDVFVFSPASTVSNDAAFSRDIKLSFQPSAMFLDAANDRLFLADAVGNTINVFDAASTLNGVATATRSIKGPTTQMNAPSGVAVDAVGKLIVLNQGSNSITVYPDAAGATGDVPAAVEIKGASTTINLPQQLVVNRSNILVEAFVANSNGGNVPIFSDLGSKTGNIAPSRNLTGTATTLTVTGAPTGIALDPTR